MSIIRFSTEEVFSTDSQEYEILYNAVQQVGKTPGAIVEIGTRRGGSMKLIIDALVQTNNSGRTVIAIDPYGNIPIECTNLNMSIHNPDRKIEGDPMSKEITSPQTFDYTNDMRNRVIPSLYFYAYQAGMNFSFMCLEDTEFFNRYGDGFPVYNNGKKVETEYAFVFIDGPHFDEAIWREIKFFEPRMPVGGIMVMDDIWMANHDQFEEYLFERGWELLEMGKIKASYIKRK